MAQSYIKLPRHAVNHILTASQEGIQLGLLAQHADNSFFCIPLQSHAHHEISSCQEKLIKSKSSIVAIFYCDAALLPSEFLANFLYLSVILKEKGILEIYAYQRQPSGEIIKQSVELIS